MADTERFKALQDAMERKTEEIKTLQRRFPDIIVREAEKERLEGEMAEIKKETTVITIQLMAEKFAEQARGYLAMAQDILAANKNEAVDAVGLLLDAIIGLRTGLEPRLDELSKLRAQGDFRDYTNLKTVGFKPNQAFAMLLARIKSAETPGVASAFAQAATTKATDKATNKIAGKVADKKK